MTSKPQHLHPIALIFFFYKTFKDAFFPIIVSIFGIANTKAKTWTLAITVILAFVVILITILRYTKFTYQITNDEIIIKSGVIEKKINHVPFDRIQNITVNQWFFLKPLNLEEIEIETASQTDKAEVSLKAVPKSLLGQINQRRYSSSEATSQETIEPKSNTYHIKWRDLLKFAFTSSVFLNGILVVLAIFGKFQHVISKQVYQSAASEFSHFKFAFVILLVLLVLLIFYVASALMLISQYYHFQLTEKDGSFEMSRGFFQTKKVSISMKRIQAIIVKQSLLRTLLGIATIKLVIVSNSKNDNSDKDIIAMPVIQIGQISTFMEQFFPEIPFKQPEVKPLKWTYYYNLRNATIFFVITLGITYWLMHPIIWLCYSLIFVELICWYLPAILATKRSKVKIVNDQLLTLQMNQFMTKQVVFIPQKNIQYLEKKESLWTQKKHVASLNINLRSGKSQRKFTVDYQSAPEINDIMNWYRNPIA